MILFLASIDLEQTIAQQSKTVVLVAAALLALLVVLSVILHNRAPKLNPWLFGAISLTMILPTLFLVVSTVYLNVKSESGGPIHWHADIELWACDTQLNLRDPKGALNNKIGTPTLHEHNDKRIHLEGVAVDISRDASVGKFMEVVGGEITDKSFTIPLNEADIASLPAQIGTFVETASSGPSATFITGQNCGDQTAEVQMFAYRFDQATNTYSQQKVEHPAQWVIAPESQVPPGDCLIVEFGAPKERTDRLCAQYGVRDKHRCQEFGVKPDKLDVCDIEEVPHGGNDV